MKTGAPQFSIFESLIFQRLECLSKRKLKPRDRKNARREHTHTHTCKLQLLKKQSRKLARGWDSLKREIALSLLHEGVIPCLAAFYYSMKRSRGLVDKISGIFAGDKKSSADMHLFYSLRVFNTSTQRETAAFSLVHWYVFAVENCNTRMNYRIISTR